MDKMIIVTCTISSHKKIVQKEIETHFSRKKLAKSEPSGAYRSGAYKKKACI